MSTRERSILAKSYDPCMPVVSVWNYYINYNLPTMNILK